MAPVSKNRRGKAAAGKKGKAATAAKSNGGEKAAPSGLSPAERRLEGVNLGDRRKAVKMAKNEESINDIAKFLGLSANKAKYLIMQQMVEDKDVPAVKDTDDAILKALKAGDEFSSVAWVSCRARVAGSRVNSIAQDAGHSFERGRPSNTSAKKSGSSARKGKKAAAATTSAPVKGKSGSKARRGKSRRGRKAASPSS